MWARIVGTFRRKDRTQPSEELAKTRDELLQQSETQKRKSLAPSITHTESDVVATRALVLSQKNSVIDQFITNHTISHSDTKLNLNNIFEQALPISYTGKRILYPICFGYTPNLISEENNLPLAETAEIKIHYIYNDKTSSKPRESKYLSNLQKIHPTEHQTTKLIKDDAETTIYMWQNKSDIAYTCIIQKDGSQITAYYGPIDNIIVAPIFKAEQAKTLELTSGSLDLMQEFEKQKMPKMANYR